MDNFPKTKYQGATMKAILVLFDTLNRRMLPPYGCEWIQAPNFERLAARTVTFENAYVGSMPCMPARRELHTGRYNFLHRSWGPLEPFDDSMPEILKQKGIYTHLISDHQHYWEDGGATYHTRYNSWEIVRGQEGDPWKGHVANPNIPETLSNRGNDPLWRQDWVNRNYQQTEDAQPQAQVFANGLEFIETNHQEDNWFLQIETFDPHEPFFTQQHYKELYPHEYDGPHFDWPDYAPVNEPPEVVKHLRMEYAALLSMCDHHLGRVLDKMDELDLWDDTLLIVTTDHGFLLGEHGWWSKVRPPFYNEVAHIPLFVWDPRLKVQGERRQVLAQMIDLPATLLEYFRLELPPDMQGTPLKHAIKEDTPTHEAILFGAHGAQVNITDGRYVYMRAPASEENAPLFEYTLMPLHMRSRFSVDELQDIELAETFNFTKGCRTMKIPAASWVSGFEHGNLLFDLVIDPGQEQPIQNPALEARLTEQMKILMAWNDAPSEQFKRMGLSEKEEE
jgi:arylsulfatase A-like enzyme